jgi:rRNA-processing protein FCF1
MPKFFVVDTNTLLHYRRPDQLDWAAFKDHPEEVVLVITPAVIHELEQQKLVNRSPRLKRRANEIIQWLNGYLEQTEPIHLADGVRLQFYDESPRVDFAAHRLTVSVPDDILIATAIQFRNQVNAEVSLLTNDTGLRMKLRSRSIAAVKPRDEDRLADEPDETEVELATTRRELHRLQTRQPNLQLGFKDSTNFITINMPNIVESPEHKGHLIWNFGQSEQAIKDYDDRYRMYLGKFETWRSEVERTFLCELTIRNVGSAEATNVFVDIDFPEGAKLLEENPKKPKPPQDSAGFLGDFNALAVHLPDRSPLRPSFGRTSATASWNIPSLVHNRHSILRPFLVRFKSEPASFQAGFTVGCKELIDVTRGALNFKIER